MRRFSLVLLAGFQLAAARSRSFSIHDDLLAFPQFEVVFAPDRVSEKQAQALVERNDHHATYSAEFSQATEAADYFHATTDAAAAAAAAKTSRFIDEDEITGYTYEILNMSPHRYLCSIPAIRPPAPVNETENALAKAEEDRENQRAAIKGWELINDFENGCLYYVSGWWSYSFCKNREIVQFHAVSTAGSGQIPRRDPNGQEYILGQVPSLPATTTTRTGDRQTNKKRHDDVDEIDPLRPPAELQIKGDQPYLVQRLEGGTMCDLTGKERTVEVQYQCVPGLSTDRIGWVKEVVTCSYVMMVDTPRLCSDVAFRPPIEKTANPIRCQLISDTGDSLQSLLEQYASSEKEQEQKQAEDKGSEGQANLAGAEAGAEAEAEAEDNKDMDKKKQDEPPQITIGGVLVGGKRVLSSGNEDGKPVKLQQLSNMFVPQPKVLEVIAQAASKADGGKITELTPEELESLNVDPKAVEKMREKLKKLAGDSGWKMELFQMNEDDEQELLGYIDEPTPQKGKGKGKDKGAQSKEGAKTDTVSGNGKPKQQQGDAESGDERSTTQRGGKGGSAKQEQKMGNKDRKADSDGDGESEGSEEEFYYRDEL
ncbi:hypothetical protein E4U55_001399 [Claviceps digitariae]|nr:hypothetical protein E4U55_001399 [Claviceps digitariae]